MALGGVVAVYRPDIPCNLSLYHGSKCNLGFPPYLRCTATRVNSWIVSPSLRNALLLHLSSLNNIYHWPKRIMIKGPLYCVWLDWHDLYLGVYLSFLTIKRKGDQPASICGFIYSRLVFVVFLPYTRSGVLKGWLKLLFIRSYTHTFSVVASLLN